jgi:nucleoid-associated protein YgaU
MQLSPLLRWLGALAVMVIVVLIAVPLLLQTVGETVVFGAEATEVASEVAVAPSELASADTVPAEDGGGGGGQDESSEASGGGSDGEYPATYEVVAGDTGSKISEQFYDTPDEWPTIAEANDIDPSAPLRVGVKLTIPAPE